MVDRRELEVWDYDLENRLKAGHVSDNGLVFDQLCAFVPFEDWEEVLLCLRDGFDSRILVCNGPSYTEKNKAMSKVLNRTHYIFDPTDVKRLVIRMRRRTGLRAPDTQGMNQFLVQLNIDV